MTKQIEVVTSLQRRRRWPLAEKERVRRDRDDARRSGVSGRPGGGYPRQSAVPMEQLCNRDGAPGFAAVTIVRPVVGAGTIEVEFATGARLRISGPIDAATVPAAITALARGERRR